MPGGRTIRKKSRTLSLTPWSIVEVLLFVAAAWFIWLVRDVFVVLFVALLLAAVVDPFVHKLEALGLPRGVGVFTVYALTAAFMFSGVFLLLPPLLAQAGAIGKGLASVVELGRDWLGAGQVLFTSYGISEARVEAWVLALQQTLGSSIEHIFSTVANVLSNAVGAVLVIVLAYYLVVEEDAARNILQQMTPRRWRPYAIDLVRRIQERLGDWMRAQILLMLIVGAMTYVGLLILDVPYALLLAVIAGLLELIPYAGPILSAIPTVLIALTVSPEKGLAVLLLCIFIQQLENNVLVPKMMERSVGLNPVVSMVALMIGYTLGGVLGSLLAIPAATAVMVFLEDIFSRKV